MMLIQVTKFVSKSSAFIVFGLAVCMSIFGGMFLFGQPGCNMRAVSEEIFEDIKPFNWRGAKDDAATPMLSISEEIEQARRERREYYKSQITDEQGKALAREHIRFGCRLQNAGFSGVAALFVLAGVAAVFAGLGALLYRFATGHFPGPRG